MKSVLFIFLFLSLLSSTVLSQWQQLNPRPTSSTTYMGAAPSANKYVAPLDLISQVLMTTDGGLTWSRSSTPSTGQIRTTYFIDDNNGWIGGAGNILYKTTDGGLTWVFVPGIDTIKYDINFLNLNEGWASGLRGFIMKTTDGGTSWSSRSISHLTTGVLYGVAPLSKDTFFVAGNTNGLFRTTDDGATWAQFSTPFGTSTDFREIKFVSKTTGFAVGNNTRIAKTTDCGETWTASYSGSAVQLWGLSFNSTGTIGLASGASSTVLRTTDGGTSWTPITGFPASLTFYSCRFAKDNDNIVYLSGSTGYVYRSTDAGATFTEISYHFTSTNLKGVNFADNNVGYAVGPNIIAKTTNGGFSWTQQTSPFSGDINEICALSPDVAIAGCDAANIVRTSNGGTNWTQITIPLTGTQKDILAIDFVSDTYGMVIGYYGSTGISTDAGLTWSVKENVLASGSIWALDMVTENLAWAGGSGIYKTSDGGGSWVQQITNSVYAIAFLDSLVGVAGGGSGALYYTSDGGTTWTPSTTPAGYTVWSIDIAPSSVYGSIALAACASGYVYKSTDGGVTWSQEPRNTISTLDDVTLLDGGHGWVVGSSGTIVQYNIPETPAGFQLTVNILDGWCMVSVPGIHPTNQHVDTWWSGRNPLASVYKWNGTYAAVTNTTPMEGYWMLHTGAKTYNTGDEWPASGILSIPHNPIIITFGWNVVGFYEDTLLVSGLTTTPPGLIVPGTIYGWNGTYYIPTQLEPGYAYWLYSNGNGVINIPDESSQGVLAKEDNKDNWGKITLTDASGKSFTLYSVNGEVNLDAYQMPPMPPSGAFDVRYSSGRRAEDLSKANQTIEMTGMKYPVRLTVENLILKLQDETGKGLNRILKAGESLSINSDITKLLVSGSVVAPLEYALDQNYPNPFNPSTLIKFSLPEDVNNVTLTIYDGLGQKVADLINGKMQAGYHQYQWNASNVASGIYIYQLRTEKFVSTKKMMLIK